MAGEAEVVVRDNPEHGRYELFVNGQAAGHSEYRDRGGRRIFVHTEIDPALAGRGLGAQLAAGALNDVRARGIPIVPRCPYIRRYIESHPEYADLVVRMRPPADRASNA